jgi:lysophospholipase L1-like esterase
MTGHHRLKSRLATLGMAVATSACIAAVAASSAFAVYPSSMAATGDSITRAFNTCSFPFTDCPANSWATGTNSTVNSFYSRILAANPAISGKGYNLAVSGAKMSGLQSQVNGAVSRGVEYVTIGMGANDACTSSESTMTSVASYQSAFQTAIDTLRTQLPNARISVGAVPNVYWLWQLLHTNSSAVSTWSNFGICQSMLANPTSTSATDEARRQRVLQRVRDFNTALRNVCGGYANCRYDNDTAFNYQFAASEVSTRDYFHPSVTGQKAIANIEWAVNWAF